MHLNKMKNVALELAYFILFQVTFILYFTIYRTADYIFVWQINHTI